MTATAPALVAPKFFDGYYTVISPKQGAPHRTLRIRTQKADAKFAPGSQLIGLLTGSDNTRSYTSIAAIGPINEKQAEYIGPDDLNPWKDYKGSEFAKIAQCLLSLLLQDRLGQNLSKLGYTVELSKRCSRCFRVLTHPASLETGIGPECAKKGL